MALSKLVGPPAFLLFLLFLFTGCGGTGRTAFVSDINGPDTVTKGDDSTFSIGVSGSNVRIHWSVIPAKAGSFRKSGFGYGGVGFDQFSSSGSGFGVPYDGYLRDYGPVVLFRTADVEGGSTIEIVATVSADQFDTMVVKKTVTVLD